MFAILSALEAELSGFLLKTEIKKIDSWNGLQITLGNFAGRDCVLAYTGIGKVNAAVLTTHIIDFYSPGYIFFTGIAGALNSDLNIGDVVIAEDCVQWDVDISSFGFKIGELPQSGFSSENKSTVRFYKTDSGLMASALNWKPGGYKLMVGRILTGDSFIDKKKQTEKESVFNDLNGCVVEMEGAASAASAYLQNIPFFLARVISDTCIGERPKKFKKFMIDSSKKASELIGYIIKDSP
jgi:5'-methylthioadenosine/S-adenosylhomocysteine nucleosidase